ncbi:hypothetical protein O3M35_009133 [Rhynocoris fuscipes]|uniref:Uncharacterized protein n=1 Tax=Rhynocoris fuscipes TaxID=488301 RepID=A0AAW1D5C5_9HEMI
MIVTPVMAEYESRQDPRRRQNPVQIPITRQLTTHQQQQQQQHSRIYLYDSGQQQQQMQPQQPHAMAEPPPVSRTYQYRKVMKPMLERKRRARINRCLDELKELMVTALQSEGENVAKLEKADILELTVKHLQSLRTTTKPITTTNNNNNNSNTNNNNNNNNNQNINNNNMINSDRYEEGWSACLSEVTHFLSRGPKGIAPEEGMRLLEHLGPRSGIRRQFITSKNSDEDLWRPW